MWELGGSTTGTTTTATTVKRGWIERPNSISSGMSYYGRSSAGGTPVKGDIREANPQGTTGSSANQGDMFLRSYSNAQYGNAGRQYTPYASYGLVTWRI